MPKGVYLHKKASEEKKRNISKSLMGHKPFFIAFGKENPFYGKKHSIESRALMSDNHQDFSGGKAPMFGKKQTEEVKSKLSKFNKGKHISPNTEFKIGAESPKKEKTYEELYGVERAKKIKEKISINNIGKKAHQGFKHNLLAINKIKVARAKQITPVKDTKIELKIQNFLRELNIEFYTHQYMHIEHGYQCDIFIPSMNMVIECDGVYWHSYPTGKDIDRIRTEELLEKGFKVLRLWEFEINDMTIDKFKERLK